MSDAGRMQRRLASSYREDDRRRADERRRLVGRSVDASAATFVDPTARFAVGTILRLIFR